MDVLSRYNVSAEAAGINDEVLKNKLGIKEDKILQDYEATLLVDAYTHYIGLLENKELKFDLSILFEIHTYFLGILYGWAGKARTVDISKNGVLFAPAAYFTTALKDFERILLENIPDSVDTKKDVANKLAVIHCEFNAIHPFREGNGRTIRLFLDLIAIEQGYRPVDYKKSSHKEYINACIAGMQKEYAPMAKIMYRGLKKRV